MPVVLNVLKQQFFVCLAVQTSLACIGACFANAPGEQQPHTPPASHALDDPLF